MVPRNLDGDASIFTRLDQLGALHDAQINDRQLQIHGSLAHTSLMGEALPTEVKRNGAVRDIDVFTQGLHGKLPVEGALGSLGLGAPAPIDAGLCGLLVTEGTCIKAINKDGVVVELNDKEGVFTQSSQYEIVGTNGLQLRSFTPIGMLAVHSLDPLVNRVSHLRVDRRFTDWCSVANVTLPDDVAASIAEFHAAYKAKYPHGVALKRASEIYTNIVPEAAKKRLRPFTHRFMHTHAGRDNPF